MPKIMTGNELNKMVADSLARRKTKFTQDVNTGLQSGAGGPLPAVNVEENFTNFGLPPNRTTEGLGQMTSSYGTAIAAGPTPPQQHTPGENPTPTPEKEDFSMFGNDMNPGYASRLAAHENRAARDGGQNRTVTGGPTSRLKEIAATRAKIARTRGI
jgi:hypothetical protein